MDKDIIRIYLTTELEKLQGQSIDHICHDCGQRTPEGEEHGTLIMFLEDKIKELK